jgi:hypothetical protein
MNDNSNSESSTSSLPICGIIMPISTIGECSEDHWLDVQHILSEAIEDAGFTPQMVSEADDIGVIQKRIIQNIYNNPMVVCDVSGKNPNVMFELGMRLAFDKPTIILKDDKTTYSFDTSPIEHLEYPRDLRFPKIVEFQEKIVEKLQGTYKISMTQSDYTTFLKHFGTFTVPVLETKEISKEEYILEEIKALKSLVLRSQVTSSISTSTSSDKPMRSLCLHCSEEQLNDILLKLRGMACIPNPSPTQRGQNHYHISIADLPEEDKLLILASAKEISKRSRLVPSAK